MSPACGPGPNLASPNSESRSGPTLGFMRLEKQMVLSGSSLRGEGFEHSSSSRTLKRELSESYKPRSKLPGCMSCLCFSWHY